MLLFVYRLGRLIVINFLLLICSIPVITTGAAICAAHKVLMDMACDCEEHVVRSFFEAFKDNFKQSTAAFLITAVVAFLLYMEFILVNNFLPSTSFLNVMFTILACVAGGVAIYLFPLITRYDNTLKGQIKNAAMIAIMQLHKTVLMVAMHAIPIILFFFFPQVFVFSLIGWFSLGISFIMYLDAMLMKPAFEEIEEEKGFWD